eukprot:gene5353-10702_t
MSYAVNFESITAAMARIKPYIHKTPVLTSDTFNSLTERNLYFKSEYLQKTGSFKARGACNAVLLTDADSVVTHSSGNHAQALAWAAKCNGIKSYVVMPNNCAPCKQHAVEHYGAEITFCEPTIHARETAAQEIVNNTKSKFIHPYNDVNVISGQGTIAIELLEQVPHLDAIIVPISGGGMCSGIAIAAKSINPNIKIIGAEPVAANDAYKSKQAGYIIENENTPNTIADGLRANLGSNTWPIIRDFVDDIMLVEEEDIRHAMVLVYERMKCVIEPSAGVPVAVALSNKFKLKFPQLKHVGVILCGGSI